MAAMKTVSLCCGADVVLTFYPDTGVYEALCRTCRHFAASTQVPFAPLDRDEDWGNEDFDEEDEDG